MKSGSCAAERKSDSGRALPDGFYSKREYLIFRVLPQTETGRKKYHLALPRKGITRPAGTPFAKLVHQSPAAVRVEKGKMENIVFSSCQRVIGAYTLSTMTRKGGINKTRKAVAKRFKVTGTGKVLRRKQGKRHILQKKSSKRKRQLGKVALVDETQVWAVKQNLPFA